MPVNNITNDHNIVVSGHPVNQVVHLINEEDVPFSFSFKEESLHTDGYASCLAVQPVSGTIQPKSRYTAYAVSGVVAAKAD